jgi:hypothetical protein
MLIVTIAVILVPVGSSQPPNRELGRVMKEKLKSAQALMEGLALADFAKIRRSADELNQLSKTDEWLVHKTPRFEVYNNEFRRSVEAIYRKAKDQNIDGVALAYVDMTLACVRCHQYVRELREARGPFAPEKAPIALQKNTSPAD